MNRYNAEISDTGKAKKYPVFPFGRSKAGTTVTVKKSDRDRTIYRAKPRSTLR